MCILLKYLYFKLNRFSQFFISPLFSESATEREINAVDSEHLKNIPNDLWRSDYVEKILCDPGHPYKKFGTGICNFLISLLIYFFYYCYTKLDIF